MANFFTRSASGGGSARAAPDAPIQLPPYTPLALNLNVELAALRAAAGSEEEMAAARRNHEALLKEAHGRGENSESSPTGATPVPDPAAAASTSPLVDLGEESPEKEGLNP